MNKFLFTPDDVANEEYTKCRAQAIAQELNNSAELSKELLTELCGLAGLSDDWRAALEAIYNGSDEFESVIDNAAGILGVNIMNMR